MDVKYHVYCIVDRGQELCESRGERPGLPVSNNPYGLCGREATSKDVQLPGSNNLIIIMMTMIIVFLMCRIPH